MESTDSQRYTLCGPPEVEARIEADQRRVVDEVTALLPGDRLDALVLAGGYGRGEGGYRYSLATAVPYNDYDYFVVLRDCTPAQLRSMRGDLRLLASRLSHEFELEVDIAVLERERLASLPSCLMYSELKWRHRVLAGDPGALDAIGSPPPWDLPLAEFSRMMLNRGALLLMNAQAMERHASVRAHGNERFLRYFSKGVLAAGDARLAAAGRYHPSVAERGRRLREIEWAGTGRDEFLGLYEHATSLKLGGVGTGNLRRTEPQALQRLAVHEWLEAYRVLESARLRRPLRSWQAYSSPWLGKGQGHGRWWSAAHHVALSLAASAGRRARPSPVRMLRHPRERLMAALPLLLESGSPTENRLAAEALGASAAAPWTGLADCFLADWRRYC
ncbi:MAG: hypothetical protein U1F08_02595 [Steroidobacteraceae bacterium]